MLIIYRTGGCLEINFTLTPPLSHTFPHPNLSAQALLEEPGWLRRREPALRRTAEGGVCGGMEEGRGREL